MESTGLVPEIRGSDVMNETGTQIKISIEKIVDHKN